jgi:hypothetical protein
LSYAPVLAIPYFCEESIMSKAYRPTLLTLEDRVQPGFVAPLAFDAGTGPVSVAVGDFNGDGKPDLAVANHTSNDVSVLLGNGDGTFQAPRSISTGLNPFSVVVGDFRGDGHQDLAVANSTSNTVSVLLGNGDGSFQPAHNINVGFSTRSVAFADFNGDGHLDLAVVYSGGVRVLLGNGDGSFQPTTVSYVIAGAGFPTSGAVGDFNGDGRPDLAVTDQYANNVSILLNDGAWPGGGAPTGGRPPGAHPRPRALAAAPASLAEEVVRRDASSRASMPLPGATGSAVQDRRPFLGPDAGPGEARAAGALVSAREAPALAPVGARAEGAARRLLDRLFAEPEGGWLADRSAGEPWWPWL